MIALSQCPGIDPVKDSSAALQAAMNLAFIRNEPITWDCHVSCIMGNDASKTVFVPNGSDVTFTPQGQLNIDNAGFPGLCFYHAAGIWRDTRIHYTGSLSTTLTKAASIWTDVTAKNYLIAHHINTFAPGMNSFWTGPTNTCAVIAVRGLSAVIFQGFTLYVDDAVPASQFVPVGIALDNGYAPGVVTQTTALVSPEVHMSDVVMDGVIMGIVGGGTHLTFRKITRCRYSDLQDADGSNLGGAGGTWFAPPHLFYLQGSIANPMTATLKDVVDDGPYVGNPLRRNSGSGMILSLKIELANGTLVDGYYSRCVDGGVDILSNGAAVGGTIRNATFLIDTSIQTIDGKCMIVGSRFPSSHPYPASSIDIQVMNLGKDPVKIGTPPPGVLLCAATQTGY